MKNILFALLLVANCQNNSSLNVNDNKYSISVWDYNYSMAYTILYHINNDSLFVKNISGISNEKDTLLINRELTKSESNLFLNLLTTLNIDDLENKYINPLVDDGERKKIIIQFNNKIKTIEIANFYQKDIDSLINAINKVVPMSLKLLYTK